MWYSGLTVYAPEFAVEHGLIEPDETAPQRREEWGQPGRMMSVYSNMVRER